MIGRVKGDISPHEQIIHPSFGVDNREGKRVLFPKKIRGAYYDQR